MTRQVALIGKPLKRRHSQVMHDAAFDAAGIDARYVLVELEPDEVEPAVRAARGPDWLGLGVTAPYKRVVATLVDEVEEDAERDRGREQRGRGPTTGVSSGSTPTRRGSAPASSWRWVDRSVGAEVVVAGAGGAAHAVVHACSRPGRARVTVGSRRPEAAHELLERFAAVGAGRSRGGRAGRRRRSATRSGRPISRSTRRPSG